MKEIPCISIELWLRLSPWWLGKRVEYPTNLRQKRKHHITQKNGVALYMIAQIWRQSTFCWKGAQQWTVFSWRALWKMLQKLAKNTSIDVMSKWVGDWRMCRYRMCINELQSNHLPLFILGCLSRWCVPFLSPFLEWNRVAVAQVSCLYFLMPYRFLQECIHSTVILWNGPGFHQILTEGTCMSACKYKCLYINRLLWSISVIILF